MKVRLMTIILLAISLDAETQTPCLTDQKSNEENTEGWCTKKDGQGDQAEDTDTSEDFWEDLLRDEIKTVCYPDIGCFDNDSPFQLLPLPQDPKEIPPKFFLYQRDKQAKQITSATALNVANLIVLIHGLTGSLESTLTWHEPIVRALHTVRPNADVLFVDWEKGAEFGKIWDLSAYRQPAMNTRMIGRYLIHFLQGNPEFNSVNAWCIGYSLGAHVCGFAGKWSKGGWGRLTALDPAGPLFDRGYPQSRVDKADALFVDAIHTSAIGLHEDVGHVDFYVHEAILQPGCKATLTMDDIVDALRNLKLNPSVGLIAGIFCSHIRAAQLFAASIKDCVFAFCPCSDVFLYHRGLCKECLPSEGQQLGYYSIDSPNRGKFWGETGGEAPYCL